MNERTDILLTDEFDLQIERGDFVIGRSDQQNVQIIFLAHPGEIKQYPLAGFGASSYLKSTVTKQEFERNLKQQLKYDGYENPEFENDIEHIKISV